ncbi:MAG: hypothetical protein A2Z83_04995 [Omnitrophica bacterium GWA2_52_8]|nr:MAG: hypothetical protein A2Z83_04995 [Omnitrophica bacterium GWA2_52_8]
MGKCPICKIVKLLAGIGALNWGLVALFNVNLVTTLLGDMTTPAKIVYILVGISGLMTLVTFIKQCPCGCTK